MAAASSAMLRHSSRKSLTTFRMAFPHSAMEVRPASSTPEPRTASLNGSLKSSEPKRSSWGTLFQSRPFSTASTDRSMSHCSSSSLSSIEPISSSTAMAKMLLSLISTL